LKKNGWRVFEPSLDPDFHTEDEWEIDGGVDGLGDFDDSRERSDAASPDGEADVMGVKRKVSGDETQRSAKRLKPQTRSGGKSGKSG